MANVTKRPRSTAPADAERAPAARLRAAARPLALDRVARNYGLVGAWIAIAVVFALLEPATFGTMDNAQTILGSQSVVLFLALGLMVALKVGDFDVSTAFVMAASAVILAKLNVEHGWPIVAAIAVALAMAVVVGLLNALLVVYLGVNSFIVTLGTGTVLLGASQWLTSSQTISGVSQSLVDWTIGNRLLGISVQFWYGVALCLLLAFVLGRTIVGRRVAFVGGSHTVARLSGLNVRRIRTGTFVVAALLSALAGVIYVGSQGGIDPSSGQNMLLPTFAAAFLGATAVTPGRFNTWGTFIAVYFLVTGITGLQLVGAQSYVQNVFYGAALVVAVTLSRLLVGRSASETDASGAS